MLTDTLTNMRNRVFQVNILRILHRKPNEHHLSFIQWFSGLPYSKHITENCTTALSDNSKPSQFGKNNFNSQYYTSFHKWIILSSKCFHTNTLTGSTLKTFSCLNEVFLELHFWNQKNLGRKITHACTKKSIAISLFLVASGELKVNI